MADPEETRTEVEARTDACALMAWAAEVDGGVDPPGGVGTGVDVRYVVHTGGPWDESVSFPFTELWIEVWPAPASELGEASTDREGCDETEPVDRFRIEPTPEGWATFKRIVDGGRAHFGDTTCPPIRWGPPRRGCFAWHETPLGEQVLVLRLDGQPKGDSIVTDDSLELLGLRPPHYLELRMGYCGPIETGLPEDVAFKLLGIPRLPSHDAARLSENDLRRLERLGLPPPRVYRYETIDDIRPAPVVRLTSKRGLAGDRFDCAILAFDYDGWTCPLDLGLPLRRWPDLVRAGDAHVVCVSRQVRREWNCFKALAELGLSERGHQGELQLAGPAWPTLLEAMPRLERKGWRFEIDPSFSHVCQQEQLWRLDVEEVGSDWFRLSLGIEVAGTTIDAVPVLLQALARRGRPKEHDLGDLLPIHVPLPDGRVVPLSAKRVFALLDVLVELGAPGQVGDDGLLLPAVQATRLGPLTDLGFDWTGSERYRELARRVRDFEGMPEVEPPGGLQTELRPYQRHGLRWLQSLRGLGLGGVLADDMGLGKTVQILAHLLREKVDGRLDRPCLVVAPTSVLPNWMREVSRFAPQLRTLLLHGSKRSRSYGDIEEVDLVVTSYGVLRKDANLRRHDFHVVVLDEAQAIKTPSSATAGAACELNARQKLALTGTPLENHLVELWSLLDFVTPGVLGSLGQFVSFYVRPIAAGSTRRLEALSRRIAPLLLRRTKAQVLPELPGKTEIMLHAELHGDQRDLYETVRVSIQKVIRRAFVKRGLEASWLLFLSALLKLRQVCCAPALVPVPKAADVQSNAKLDLFRELVVRLVGEGRRILVFSQFTSMLSILSRELDRLKIAHLELTGATRDRQQLVDRFQSGERPVFLISLKAGGTGLNLTAADTVIHYDPWWNPAVESQATDRSHRLGQSRPVTVYKLICRNTVEERMLLLQRRKQDLATGVQAVAESRAPTTPLDAEDLEALLAP